MSFPYKTALVVGATSGIGAGLADRLVDSGVQVVAVGRRQERLDAFVAKHGKDKAGAFAYDITDKEGLPGFVKKVITAYPDLDCVVLNAGTQGQHHLSRPAEVDLDAFHNEMYTNFTCIVNLSMALLPHLQAVNKSGKPTAFVFTGTNLCLVPAFPMPAYSASKAALNSYVYSLRVHLSLSETKVIEIWPPAVQTELHDYFGEEQGRAFGMPLKAFLDEVMPKLLGGAEEIIVGTVGSPELTEEYHKMVAGRKGVFDSLSKMMLAHFPL